MTSLADDGGPIIRDRPDHKRKRSLSRSYDPPTGADDGSDPPLDQKRSRVQSPNDTAAISAHSPSVESKTPTIIESAVSELRLDAQNRLDKLKERLDAWERNGVVS
jgi:hypothetical protein